MFIDKLNYNELEFKFGSLVDQFLNIASSSREASYGELEMAYEQLDQLSTRLQLATCAAEKDIKGLETYIEQTSRDVLAMKEAITTASGQYNQLKLFLDCWENVTDMQHEIDSLPSKDNCISDIEQIKEQIEEKCSQELKCDRSIAELKLHFINAIDSMSKIKAMDVSEQ